ncbi:MAG: hypothetical protein HRT69_15820 [Flavobacteriaceae bacterium]|nr:hypothetical protein [Flavobacteriaceae bacterium]
MKTIQYKLFVLFFLSICTINAQTKLEKTNQSIKVAKDVTLNLNTNYCNIELDTWNKNVIEIEAYIEGEKISKEDLENWGLTIDATTNNVTITTQEGRRHSWNFNYVHGDNEAAIAIIEELKFELADIPEIHIAHIEDFEFPELPEMPELPELPEGIHELHFDYKAYKKNGDKYLDKWSENIEKKFGKGYEKKMEAWAKKFEKEWTKKHEEKIKIWEERLEEKNELLEERLEKRNELLEKRLEEGQKIRERKMILLEKREHQREDRRELAEKRRLKIEHLMDSNSKVKRTIKIKIPKKAKVKLNVRHGELKLVSNINNLNADLSHTRLVANSINGRHTSINASYSPIFIKKWGYGKLNLNYVEEATLENVERLILTSNFSNIKINKLIDNANIDTSFGDLHILKIEDTFTNLKLIVQNGNAIIVSPNTKHYIHYKGSHSRLKHPKNSSKESNSSFSAGDSNNPKKIILNAKYSTIKMH